MELVPHHVRRAWHAGGPSTFQVPARIPLRNLRSLSAPRKRTAIRYACTAELLRRKPSDLLLYAVKPDRRIRLIAVCQALARGSQSESEQAVNATYGGQVGGQSARTAPQGAYNSG